MRTHTILTKAASVAACFGIFISSTASAFEGGRQQVARDVELTSDGTLNGQIYTTEGRAVENAAVELRYQGVTVARAMTGNNGDFAVTGVRGGAHDLRVGAASTSVRLWKNGTAPAGSAENLVMAANENVVRGQAYDENGNPCNTCPPTGTGFGLIDVVTLAMLGTSVAALVIAIDTNNEVDDLAKRLPASP
ncbi:MAG TPA: carboxypeptidase-like regulatory domain-containing protein [Planctomycetaceae bacterium]|nr:carboxypeptidase-like regulatory domain-containing protein [Planctomycetaceae bacterium]HQZ69368.1 carboxypeptidase-like regulatory domain-containing protein [Planctomycetaceae bacterium]